MNIFIRLILCLFSFSCLAVGDKDYTSARHYGLGGASTTLVGGGNSLDNQGTLGLVDTSSLSFFYGNRYFLKELSTYGLGLIKPIKSGVLGVSIIRFGSNYYSQNNIGLAFGKVLTEKFSFGLRLNYLRLQQFEYGNTGLVTAEVGMLTKVSEQLSIGAHIYNPFRVKLTTENDGEFRSESGLRVGANYQLNQVNVLIEMESNTVSELLVKTALEYQSEGALFIRAGFVYPQKQVSAGLGVTLKYFKTDLYYQYHLELGNSSGVSLSYAF